MVSLAIDTWRVVYGFVGSSLFGTFLSTLVGAGFGAWGAQRLSERALQTHELLESLRKANAIIVLAATITNNALSLKGQFVKPLTDRYFSDRKAAETHNKSVLGGFNPPPQVFQAELTKFTPLVAPVEALGNIALEGALMPGRALALTVMLQKSIAELSSAIALHTSLVDNFYAGNLPPEIYCQDYFGLKRRDGNENRMYHDALIAVRQYNNDVIFFGSELSDELHAHGQKVRAKLVRRRKGVPKVSSVDFSHPTKLGLMPPRSDYEGWLSGIRQQDE
jgi:hypothetical protein